MSRFCTAPWINLSTDVNGSIRPCCRYEQPDRQTKYKMPWMKDGTLDELYNSTEMQALRQAFINGEEPEECSWCWKEEDVGINSFRQMFQARDAHANYDITTSSPRMFDLKLSNVCNLKCRMCGPTASSSIAKELNMQNPYWLSNKIIATDNERLFFEDWLPDMVYLELTGGEPFFSLENKKLIERVSSSKYAKDIHLKITTNGMFYIPALMDKMKKFNKVSIALSVDDIGDRLEYQRGNSKWDLIQDNILSMVKNYPKFNIEVYRTVNNFNIYYLDELDEWCNNNKIHICNGLLHEPKYLSVQYLSSDAKKEVNEKFSNKYKPIIKFMNIEKDHALLEFHNETIKLDKMRNESFNDSFEEWAEIMLW